VSPFHPPIDVDNEEEYEIKSIKVKHIHGGRTYYLVHWLRWPSESDQWIATDQLLHAQDLVDDFEDNATLAEQVQLLSVIGYPIPGTFRGIFTPWRHGCAWWGTGTCCVGIQSHNLGLLENRWNLPWKLSVWPQPFV
jgi:Chromo (CHRromatin Organisation MOdifier) domain